MAHGQEMRHRKGNAAGPPSGPPDPTPSPGGAPTTRATTLPSVEGGERVEVSGPDGTFGGDGHEIGPATRTMIDGLDRDSLRASRLGRGEGPIVAERRAFIARMLNAGAPRSVILEEVMERFGVVERTAANEIVHVRSERADLFEDERKTMKSEQVARLQRDLAEMRSSKSKPWKSIANHEVLLAKITGTIEPTHVDVSMSLEVTNALAIFVARLGPEEIEAMVAEQHAIESGDPLALPAARMLPIEGRRYAGAGAGWTASKRTPS